MLKLHLFLKIPMKGKFRLVPEIYSALSEMVNLSLSIDVDGNFPPFYFSRHISTERAYDQNDFHLIGLY